MKRNIVIINLIRGNGGSGSWKSFWLVGCFGLSGPLRQYFSLYLAVSQREGEREEKE